MGHRAVRLWQQRRGIPWSRPEDLLLVASVLVNTLVFVFVFRVTSARHLTVADVAPGAAGAAVIWQLLQTFGVA